MLGSPHVLLSINGAALHLTDSHNHEMSDEIYKSFQHFACPAKDKIIENLFASGYRPLFLRHILF